MLIEFPEERRLEKQKKLEAMSEPKQPQFDSTKLIQLDGLHDMATRGKMETRQRFHSQIINRQQKIAQKVKSID